MYCVSFTGIQLISAAAAAAIGILEYSNTVRSGARGNMGLPLGPTGNPNAGQSAKAEARAAVHVAAIVHGDDQHEHHDDQQAELHAHAHRPIQQAGTSTSAHANQQEADNSTDISNDDNVDNDNDDNVDNDSDDNVDNDSDDNDDSRRRAATSLAWLDTTRSSRRGSTSWQSTPGAWFVAPARQAERRRSSLDGQSTTAISAGLSSTTGNVGHQDEDEEAITTVTSTSVAHDAVVTDAVAIPVQEDVSIAVMDSEAIAQHEQRLIEQGKEESKRELEAGQKRRMWLCGGVISVLLILAVIISVSVVATSSGAKDQKEATGTEQEVDECPGIKILTDSVKQGDNFGYAADMSGNVLLIGALSDSTLGEESGAAYIFRQSERQEEEDGDTSWIEEAKIYPDDGIAGDKFGVKLSLNEDGKLAAISADQVDLGKGAVYLYAHSDRSRGSGSDETAQWVHQAKLMADDAVESAQFGDGVDINGDTIVVGQPHPDQLGFTGAVYVFEKDGNSPSWTQTHKLIPKDVKADNATESIKFGTSVALSGNTLVVGADKDGPKGPFSGSAYIFRRETGPDGKYGPWVEEANIFPVDGGESQFFGYDVDIDASGDTVIISSWKDGTVTKPATEDKAAKTEQIGSVYIFTRTSSGQWEQAAKLTANDGEPGDRFGNSVSINREGDTLLIGAYHDEDRRGSAYLFRKSRKEGESTASWTQTMKFRAADVNIAEEFASQVVLDGTQALLTEPNDFDLGYEAGAAHIYDVEECPSSS